MPDESEDRSSSTLLGLGALIAAPIALYFAYCFVRFVLGAVVSVLAGIWGLLCGIFRRPSAAGRKALEEKEKRRHDEAVSKAAAKQQKRQQQKPRERGEKPKPEQPKPPTAKPPAPAPVPPPAAVVSKQPQRQRTFSDQFTPLKGLKQPPSALAVGNDYIYACTERDRVHRLFLVKSLQPGCQVRQDQVRLDRNESTQASFSPCGRYLAVYIENDLTIKVFRVQEPNCLTEPEWGKKDFMSPCASFKIDLSRDLAKIVCGAEGNYVVCCDVEGFISVWKSNLGQRYGGTVDPMQGRPRCWSCSPDGSLLGLAASMAAPRVYHVESKMGQFIPHTASNALRSAFSLRGHAKSATGVGFGSNGRRSVAVSMSEEGVVKLWDVDVRHHMGEDPRPLCTFEDTDFDCFSMAAFSPDLKHLALCTKQDVLIYSLSLAKSSAEARLVGELSQAHKGNWIVEAHFISPTTLLTSAAADRTVKLWAIPDSVPAPQPV
eukprot:TRINITY_DN18769_c0_g1_i1.p1 TRINITY_DN18769_c0_g1~~TRINITY_DN18769_c0_g1_i1.p1  ORF type:complete len:489 (+),score=177.96 TRINITY_DN18769_c0_g1_i1:80-1546(+)